MNASFDSFGLHPDLLRGLTALGFTIPTPVQAHAIPLLLEGRDAIVQAKTGSGKTLAFGLPLLSLLEKGPKPQALIVLPTRELAIQVCEAIANVSKQSPLRVLPIYGGVGLGPQEDALRRGIDIVVGTPGRLKDLFGRKSLDLSQVKILVLDEADEMLDMGFRRDIDFLLDRLPARQQTLILSATMPESIEAIARKHLKDPAVVKLVQSVATPTEISHAYLRVSIEKRLDALLAILDQEKPKRAIIFTRMKHETKRLALKIEKLAGMEAGFLNGNMSQNARNSTMARFKAGEFRFLIATDVAARGIDVEGLTHVIHYAVPTVVETYIHRSGRTGRAGNEGKTIILVTPDAEADFKAILRRVPGEAYPLDLSTLPDREFEPDPPPPPRQGRNQAQGRQPRAPRENAPQPPGRSQSAPRTSQSRVQAPAPRFPARQEDDRAAARQAFNEERAERPTTGPLAPLPRLQTQWRKFKLALGDGHTQTRDSLHSWLADRTGVARSALRSIAVHGDHATVEVETRHTDRFLQGLKGATIR